MFGRFKEKSQGFIIGLMVGLIVAGGFFILKLDDYFSEMNLVKNMSHTFTPDSKEAIHPASSETEKRSKTTKPGKKEKKITSEDPEEETKKASPDSVTIAVKDSLILESPVAEDDIVIRKDELLSTKTLEVLSLDPIARMTQKDSLLQKVSGIKDDRSSKQYFNIEFWSSPLNYKGYRMSKYKLILYGVSSADGIKLFKLDDVIYMKSAGLTYRLDPTGDFKPYERITDETILSRLK